MFCHATKLGYCKVFLSDLEPRKYLSSFNPSRRRIEFLQKNIRQLNVEFIETNVVSHTLNGNTFSLYNDIFCAEHKPDITIPGKEHRKKHITAKKHVETFLNRKYVFYFQQK